MSGETATLAGGCFWCVEAVYKELQGVESVAPGYTGGTLPNPTYEQVCTGTTGHAEAVQITFDPHRITYREILEVFFSVHDPTTLNRQGADVGTQYRSAIFHHDEAQKQTAEDLVRELTQAKAFKDPIVTEIKPAGDFYPAETYHRDYFQQHPQQPYCQLVIAPKMAKFRKQWAKRLKGRQI